MRKSIRSLGLFGWRQCVSILKRITCPSAAITTNDRPQRMKDLDRTGMRGEHVGDRRPRSSTSLPDSRALIEQVEDGTQRTAVDSLLLLVSFGR